MRGFFVFLGTGASTGVPLVGCRCPVCTSSSDLNKRLRPAGWLQIEGRSLLIDVGPDFRQQALTRQIERVDGLLLTHTHFDHIAGIDELRAFCRRQRQEIPCLLSEESFVDLKRRYYYFFQNGKNETARLTYQLLSGLQGHIDFLDLPFEFCSYRQGDMGVTGYRIGDFAYVSDIKEYDESIFASLRGVRYLIVSALQEEASPVHLSVEEAAAFGRKVGAKQTWITHISHSIDHEKTTQKLPEGVGLGFDGLTFEFKI